MADNVNQDARTKEVLLLFDVDGTITPARKSIEKEMDIFLQSLRSKVSVGLVGGSDLNKIAEQTKPSHAGPFGGDIVESCVNRFDYVFAENGLVAYKNGQLIGRQSLLQHLGEDKLQTFINFCLAYMSDLRLPAKRGNFIEFRNGLINVCPVGRSCSQAEREEFNRYDQENQVRSKFIEELNRKFGPDGEQPLGLVYSIGGQISFDAFPRGWDKTFCLNFIDPQTREIHFFGDKTGQGGNDCEIFNDPRTIGHTVLSPSDTLAQLRALNLGET